MCYYNVLLYREYRTREDFSPIGQSLVTFEESSTWSLLKAFPHHPTLSDERVPFRYDFHRTYLPRLSADRWSAIITDPSVLGVDERPHFYVGSPSIICSYRRIWSTDRADRYNPLIEWNRCYFATDRNVRPKEIRRMKYGRSTRWLVDFRAMAASPLPFSWELSHETWSVSNFICHL